MYVRVDAHVYLLKEGEREIYTGPSGALLAARHCSSPMTREGSVYSLFS